MVFLLELPLLRSGACLLPGDFQEEEEENGEGAACGRAGPVQAAGMGRWAGAAGGAT